MTNILGSILPIFGTSAISDNESWSISNLLKNGTSSLKSIGSLFMILLGVVMIIVGGWKLAKGLISHGGQGGQTNWFIVALLIIVGGAFAAGGLTLLTNVASGATATIDELAKGVIHF